MSNSTVQYIQTHTTASVQPSKVLRGGSSVFVRVISESGAGRYTVSFAGNRVDVQSARPLAAGQSFLATVRAGADGKILLVPRNGAASAKNSAASDNILVSSRLQTVVLPDGTPNAALASFLAAQGLVPDAVTVRLLQFLQQTGVKTDVCLMQKARAVASHFPGNEGRAAEAAMLLLGKGVEPDDALIAKLLLLFDSMDGGGSGSHGKEAGTTPKHQGRQRNGADYASAQAAGLQPGAPVGAEETFLDNLYENEPSRKPGLLALVNQLSNGPKHWLFLPYEWQFVTGKAGGARVNSNQLDAQNDGDNGDTRTAKGIIRVLVDTETQKIEKIAINCRTTLTNYFFVLYYTASKVKEVRFCTLPPLLPSKEEELRLGELLRSGMNLGSPVTVTYSTSAYCDGLCTEEIPPLFLADDNSPAPEAKV